MMQRHCTGAETRALVRDLREKVPGVVLRTTMIVGHPGEGEKEFEELLDFVREARFERLGAFKYSEEEGTYGAEHYADDVPEEVKEERLAILMETQREISLAFNRSRVGTVERVLVDAFDGDYYQEHMLLALIGYALLAAFTVFTITVLANMICCWIKDRSIMNLIMTILVVAEIASYISFCFKYPYTCTMSFRYIVPTLIAGAYYSGRSKDVSPNLLSLITTISVWALALVSFVFHCLIWIKG